MDYEGPTITFRCANGVCPYNLDESGHFLGAIGTYEVRATRETEGAAPPYGPPGGLHDYLVPDEDDMACPECGEIGEEA